MNKVWPVRYFFLFALMAIFPATALAFTCTSTGGNWATAGTWTSCNGTTPQAGDTVVVNSGSVVLNTSATISGLTVNGGTLVFGNNNTARTLTVNGNIAVAAGATVNVANNNATHVLNISGNLTNNGTFDLYRDNNSRCTANFTGGGTHTIDGSSAGRTEFYNVSATTGGNLTINKTGAAVTQTGTLNVGGNLAVQTGTLNLANTVSVTGTTSVSGILGIISTTGTKTFTGTVTINSGGTWSNTANEAVSFSGGITNNGTFTGGTGTQTFNINNQALGGTSPINFGGIVAVVGARTITNNNTNIVSIAGNLTGNNANSTWVNAANSTLNYGGALAPMGTRRFNATAVGNTVNYNRTGTQTVKLPAGNAYHHLTLSGSGVKTLPATAMTIAGNFTVSGTASATAAANLTVGGNWNETGTFNPGTSTVTLNGTAAQTISGTSPVNFNNLTVTNATSPNITLATNVTVTGTLTGTVTLTSTCPIDYTLTAGALVMHSCPPVMPPANFVCIEAGATFTPNPVAPDRNPLYTKLAGTAFSFDVIALKADGTVETSYASASNKNVTVELVDGSGATACASRTVLSPAVSQTLTFAAINAGRKAVSITVNKAYADLRCRVTDANQAPSIVGCSTDNFSIRSTGFVVTSSANSDPAGTNASAVSPIKAGANFTLTATASAGYNGTPLINSVLLAAHPGAGYKGSITGTFPAATLATGVSSNSVFTYSEVGYFRFGADSIYDGTFTAVDNSAGDCVSGSSSNTAVSGKFGCNIGNAVSAYFGRFIPDHFNTSITAASVMPCPTGLTCPCPPTATCPPSLTRFVYSGQPFSANVFARNVADQATRNYEGSFSKSVTLSAVDAAGGAASTVGSISLATSTVNASAFVSGTTGAGTPADPVFAFNATPTVPTDVHLRAIESAGDGVFSLRDPASTSWEQGIKVVSGRIKVANAYGSELLPLSLTATVQFYKAAGSWVVSDTDTVTTITASDFALAFPVATANKLAACETALSVTGSSPSFNVNLSAPGTGNNGWTDLTLNLGAVATGNRCTVVGGAGAASTTANRPWLQYPVGVNPAARGTFGVYKGNNTFIYQRESY